MYVIKHREHRTNLHRVDYGLVLILGVPNLLFDSKEKAQKFLDETIAHAYQFYKVALI